MNYTAISIGPIIATLSQVRKPRHLWSASYMFSHLMKIIIEEREQLGGMLISPAKEENLKQDNNKTANSKLGIGLYPDRAFFESKIEKEGLIDIVLQKLSEDIGIEKGKLNNYFNIMEVTVEANSESEAIYELNRQLDVLELANRCEDSEGRTEILNLISSKNKESILFELAFEEGGFPINTLAQIASIETKSTNPEVWKNAKEFEKLFTKNFPKAKQKDLVDEDLFYKLLRERMPEKLKSYHKYFCVVQADGDSMGKVIGNLKNGKLNELSKALITFGIAASDKVKDFGGLPIYAGGDDLLFIAPVVSEKGNIFDLIKAIDTLYNEAKSIAEHEASDKRIQKEGKIQPTSMSYGISINYYKYPLYEVLEDARNLLFEEAKIERNTIALRLRKHSGSSFKILMNKSDDKLKEAFEKLIKIAVEDNMVSATAHKLRENSVLWQLTQGNEKRLEAFFKTTMGLGEKESNQNDYLKIIKEIAGLLLKEKEKNLPKLVEERMKEDIIKKKIEYEVQETIKRDNIQQYHIDSVKESIKAKIQQEVSEKINKSENTKINETIYSMLRIAKFINGEEVKDE